MMLPTDVTLAATVRAAERVEGQRRVLADRQTGAVVLVDVGADLELAQVEHLGHRRAALHLVARRGTR